MITVDVDLDDRAYPIHIGSGLLSKAELFALHIHGTRAVIATNETVAPLYAVKAKATIRSLGKVVDTVVLSDEESSKKWDALNHIFDTLLMTGVDRKTTPITLDGGIVGDMTGSAAVCYMCDVLFTQVSVTLLPRVDSSVGGKTGINRPLGRNVIGAFRRPRVVLTDIDTLRMLPARELAAGMAKVVKHGTIADADYFVWIEQNIKGLNDRDIDLMTEAVRSLACIKATAMVQNERETSLRVTLSFGRTFGHAIEADLGYDEWLYDEAVSCDIVMTADLSYRLDFIDTDTRSRIIAPTRAMNLPTAASDLGVDRFIDLMCVDKKIEADKIEFVLLRRPGQMFVTAVPDADLRVTSQHAVL